jgi:uncharacterized protein (DUF302 family)
VSYGTSITVRAPFADTVARVRAALAGQGFGVLTEIDVTATLRAKLGEQMEDYVILGACNPPFAHQALGIDRSIGLLLPCNVVVRATGDTTVVEALDPQVMVTLTGRQELKPVAGEVGRRLASALAELTRCPSPAPSDGSPRLQHWPGRPGRAAAASHLLPVIGPAPGRYPVGYSEVWIFEFCTRIHAPGAPPLREPAWTWTARRWPACSGGSSGRRARSAGSSR